MPTDDPPLVPSNEELRERAANALAHHALFRNTSRRMLIDLVDKFDLRRIRPAGDPIGRPAILAVLEKGIVVEESGGPRTPFTPGVYAAHERSLFGIDWPSVKVFPAGDRAVRVFVLRAQDFLNSLPQILVNAMDPHVLEQLVATL